MAAGEDPFAREPRARRAEEGDVVALEPAAIVLHLPQDPIVTILAAEVLEDFPAEGPLRPGQVADRRLDDRPVALEPRPLRVVVREAEAPAPPSSSAL